MRTPTVSTARGTLGNPDGTFVAAGVCLVVAIVVGVTFGMDMLHFDVIIGILTVLALWLVSIPAIRYVARQERNMDLMRIMFWGLFAKIIFTLVRYYFITVVYSDNGDAGVYHGAGAILMDLYRQGIFTLQPPGIGERGPETARIAVVVAIIYLVTGASRYAASFVFSWLCFTGQVLMFRAMRRGVPESDPSRYLLLVLFIPSMLFWPSSIGKEALMVFCVGVASYGASQILGSQVTASGLATFAAGAAGLFYIRPHMALIAIVALGVAMSVSAIVGFKDETDKRANGRAFALRMLALLVLIGGASVATTRMSKVLGSSTEGAQGGVADMLHRTTMQTSEGGSKFQPIAVTSPVQIPAATVTVLFRPFPWEAKNSNGLIASSEGLLLGGLMVVGRRRLVSFCKLLGRRPYLVYALAYALTFIIVFSYVGNFGILARQRTQMIPLALTPLGMPLAPYVRSGWFRGSRDKGGSSSEGDARS